MLNLADFVAIMKYVIKTVFSCRKPFHKWNIAIRSMKMQRFKVLCLCRGGDLTDQLHCPGAAGIPKGLAVHSLFFIKGAAFAQELHELPFVQARLSHLSSGVAGCVSGRVASPRSPSGDGASVPPHRAWRKSRKYPFPICKWVSPLLARSMNFSRRKEIS